MADSDGTLPRIGDPAIPESVDAFREDLRAAQAKQAKARSANTRRAYDVDWRRFQRYCAERGLQALPADVATVVGFLGWESRRLVYDRHGRPRPPAPATISRAMTAIAYAHKQAGLVAPNAAGTPGSQIILDVLMGIRRDHSGESSAKDPLTADLLARVIDAIPEDDSLANVRDRALLMLGFAGAFRRSELAALHVADLAFKGDDLLITIRRSKTDQEGKGDEVAILHGVRLCPVRSLRRWLELAGIEEGSVFRRLWKPPVRPDREEVQPPQKIGGALTPQSVRLILANRAAAVGLSEDAFGAHSLRSGFLTSAAENGASIWKMMEVSRHTTVETVRRYVRRAEKFKDHAGKGLY